MMLKACHMVGSNSPNDILNAKLYCIVYQLLRLAPKLLQLLQKLPH